MKDKTVILIRKWFKSKTGIDLMHDPSLISLVNEIEDKQQVNPQDVDKVFEEWVKITPDEKTSDWPRLTKAFALYYAHRCGVVLDGNSEIPNNHKCDHPYHSVVGGNGRPERCLACGKVLSI